MRRVWIFTILLAGCSTMGPTTSYVSPDISASDAAALAVDAVKHLAGPLAPAHTTIVLDPPASTHGKDVMTRAMVEQLRAKGYGVVQIKKRVRGKPVAPIKGVLVRYVVSPAQAGAGVLLRLQYQGGEAARFYPRKDGALSVADATPFTVRQVKGGTQ